MTRCVMTRTVGIDGQRVGTLDNLPSVVHLIWARRASASSRTGRMLACLAWSVGKLPRPILAR
jgi:hypothetical protein